MTAHDLRIIAEQRAAEQKAVDERDEADGATEASDDTTVAALALAIRLDPIKAAQRIVTLEGQQRIMRDHLEALTRKLGAVTLGVTP